MLQTQEDIWPFFQEKFINLLAAAPEETFDGTEKLRETSLVDFHSCSLEHCKPTTFCDGRTEEETLSGGSE